LWITYDALHFYLGQMLDLKKKFELSSQDYNDYVVEDLKWKTKNITLSEQFQNWILKPIKQRHNPYPYTIRSGSIKLVCGIKSHGVNG
jgi:hypothetical protein